MGSATRRSSSLMTGLKTRLETPSFEESLAFYRDLLGMKVLEVWDAGQGAILGLGASAHDEAFLELARVEGPRRYEGISLQFRVRDLEAVMGRLRGRWDFRGPTKRPWGSTYVYVRDPTDVQVILFDGKQ